MDEPTTTTLEEETMSTRKNIIVFAVALIVVVGAAGAIVWQQFYQPKKVVTGPISVIDDLGRNVTITNYPPERIVSLAASSTEILCALDLQDNVVGVDEYSDYPIEVKERVDNGNLTIVGSFADISVETVVGLQPDLILGTGGIQLEVVEKLEELGETVIVLYAYGKGFAGVLADISLVGEATGQIDEAEALVADMQKKAQEITDKTQGAPIPRVYIEYFFNGGFWTYGAESYLDDLISIAGGTNVFTDVTSAYFTTSTEEVLKANPEIIIISKGDMAIASGLTPETMKTRPGWSAIHAVQNDHIYEIDEDIVSRPGPRMVNALETLATLLHPELFS